MRKAAPWIYLLLPGIALHELAHATVARRWADVDVDWTIPRVEIEWGEDVPVIALFATFLAPLWPGGLAALALAQLLPGMHSALALWLLVNWLLLAGPSVVDVASLLRGLAA